MTNPETILSGGKRIAAIASGRAFREEPPKATVASGPDDKPADGRNAEKEAPDKKG